MPSGYEAFQRKQAVKEQQKAASGADGVRADFFRIDANQYAIVRFLEQGPDLTYADVHKVPVEGRRYGKEFICLNTNDDGTPCPACQHPDEAINKRRSQGYVNLIWRDGPLYQRDAEKGFVVRDPNTKKPVIVGRADGVFLWTCSWTVYCMLMDKDARYKGLMSRDWEIKRTGSTMQDTKYAIEPADPDGGPKPMMIADLSLQEGKYDLAALTRPMSYQDLAVVLNRGAVPNQGPQPTMDRSSVLPTAQNTFQPDDAPLARASAFTRG